MVITRGQIAQMCDDVAELENYRTATAVGSPILKSAVSAPVQPVSLSLSQTSVFAPFAPTAEALQHVHLLNQEVAGAPALQPPAATTPSPGAVLEAAAQQLISAYLQCLERTTAVVSHLDANRLLVRQVRQRGFML